MLASVIYLDQIHQNLMKNLNYKIYPGVFRPRAVFLWEGRNFKSHFKFDTNMSAKKLKVQIGVCKRMIKEVVSYEKEAVTNEARIQKMRDDGRDIYGKFLAFGKVNIMAAICRAVYQQAQRPRYHTPSKFDAGRS